jgi:hypothetical protein
LRGFAQQQRTVANFNSQALRLPGTLSSSDYSTIRPLMRQLRQVHLAAGTADGFGTRARQLHCEAAESLQQSSEMKSLIQVTAWERVSLWRRILGAVARVTILIAFLDALINVFGPPIGIFFTARWETRKFPGVRVAPQPLSDYSVSDAPGTVLTYFGYKFEVPWSANFKERVGRGLVQLKFQSGQDLILIVPENQGGLLTEILKDESLNMKNWQPVFGDLMNRSAYDQYAALLNATPQSIRSFRPRGEAARGITLLTIKAIAIGPGLETGVFSFEFSDKRGFQVGDPRKSKRADLELFGMGGHYVEIICSATKDNVRLSQPELNRILTSLHPVSGDPAAAPPADNRPTKLNDKS